MTLSDRNRRALAYLAVSVGLSLIWEFWFTDSKPTVVNASGTSIELVEKRLAKMRQLAAQVPGQQEIFGRVQSELAAREKGILQADTAAQAQAQLLQVMRHVMRSQAPPIEPGPSEIGQIRAIDTHYGEVEASVSFQCRIEQLVNLLADVANQKELIATSEIRVGSGHPKEKIVPVRITVAGIVKRELVPEKKGFTSF